MPDDGHIQESFQINAFTRSNDHCLISFNSSNAVKSLTFLIDTGAATSLIKHDSLNPKITRLNTKYIITFTGINPIIPIRTLGSSEIDLSVKDLNLKFRINVINLFKINTPYDGILGNNFFQQQNAEINYNMKYINICSTLIPFNNTISKDNKKDVIYLPPRSKLIVQVQVKGQVKEGITVAKEIAKNFFFLRHC